MKDYIYILLEQFNNQGEISSSVIASSFSKETIQKEMRKKFEEYKTYGYFDYEYDDLFIEEDEDSIFIQRENNSYYGDLVIIKQKII